MSTRSLSLPVPQRSLAVENVRVEYGEGRAAACALEDVSVSFQPGRLTLLMGPSGSGKTTLLSVLGCLVTPQRGSVFVMNREVTDLPEQAKTELRRQKLGYVFQAFQLFRALTALENILLALELSNRRGRRAPRGAPGGARARGFGGKRRPFPPKMGGGEKTRAGDAAHRL